MVKAVIFDIDGTLIDTVDMHAEAWRLAFLEFGKEVPFRDIRSQIGKGGDQLLPVFFSEGELDKIQDELETVRGNIYRKQFMPKAKAFPGVRRLFEMIRADGRSIALASSAPAEELEYYKKLTNIADLIEEATSSDDAEKSKPHPDIFEAALDGLGLEGKDCIAVGDTPYDAISAGGAGIRTIGVLCGGFSNERLVGAGCIEIYEDPADIAAQYASSAIAG